MHIVTVQESDGSNPVTFVVLIDTTLPDVIITTPAEGEFIIQGQEPAADYDCLDAGSGISSCVAPVANGDPVPSATIGINEFEVTAQDYAHQSSDPPNDKTKVNSYYVVESIVVDGPVDPTAIGEWWRLPLPQLILMELSRQPQLTGVMALRRTVDLTSMSLATMSGSHIYSIPDVYQVTVSVDYGGLSTQKGVLDFVVIYDGSGGFVTGGGWIDSPPGAYTPNDSNDPYVTGKAHFGFMSKYKKGQSAPDGSTNFRFAAGDLKFDSTSYDWMIISGSRARYKGEGMVNDGPGLYKFMITALDADISDSGIIHDGFRIKIWQEDSDGTQVVLYDNGLGADEGTGNGGTTPLGGGSIKIHSGKKKK